ncbi:hypothetical protein MLD38_008800 [Melastoma candidum]|uniref:Uncharacterized protein n=1 Tax=Melastoma candidum TaxID=119954 RepID=A0ACB9RVP2_9MYRT|nr:hypothetical protein MLD38_008800 [Melastoma candidum]
MSPRPRKRKRVRAPRRAPDGSAFQKCDLCGETVAVAVSDLHECQPNMGVKRFKGFCGKVPRGRVAEQDCNDQPRSAFLFFMESFVKTRVAEEAMDANRLGFETWKKLSKEERQPYLDQATKTDVAYKEVLLREVHETSEMEDEADSAMVGRVDQMYERFDEDLYDSESLGLFASFDSSDWLVFSSWD